jgi:hypothetical protein
MNVRHEIDELASALLPPYELRKDWPHDAQATTDRLFSIIVGMYMANQLTSDQLGKLVHQLDGQQGRS